MVGEMRHIYCLLGLTHFLFPAVEIVPNGVHVSSQVSLDMLKILVLEETAFVICIHIFGKLYHVDIRRVYFEQSECKN